MRVRDYECTKIKRDFEEREDADFGILQSMEGQKEMNEVVSRRFAALVSSNSYLSSYISFIN